MIDLRLLAEEELLKVGQTVLLKVNSIEYHSPAGVITHLSPSCIIIQPLETKNLQEMQDEMAEMYNNHKLAYSIFDADDIKNISVMTKHEKTDNKSNESSSGS